MTVRLQCCVPFCRRTRGPRKGDPFPLREGMDWLCEQHWRSTPTAWRRALNRAQRRSREAGGSWEATAVYWHGRDMIAVEGRLWRRIKRRVVERTLGGRG